MRAADLRATHRLVTELNQALHRNINSSRAYRPPVELARALFAANFNSPARPVNAAEDKPGS